MNCPHPQRLKTTVPVETIAITQGEAVKRITLLGQIEASEQQTVRTQTDGLVQQVLVQSGDRVTPEQLLQSYDADQQLAVASTLGWHKNAVNWRV